MSETNSENVKLETRNVKHPRVVRFAPHAATGVPCVDFPRHNP